MSFKKSNTSVEDSGSIIIHDRSSRRVFMRRGAAFLAAAGALASSGRSALAADCDRGGSGEQKPEHAGNGSDSDTGANADPTGCGRNYEEKPKISQRGQDTLPEKAKKVSVTKIVT